MSLLYYPDCSVYDRLAGRWDPPLGIEHFAVHFVVYDSIGAGTLRLLHVTRER